MKKIFLYASAVVAMLAAGSCQKEIDYLEGDTNVTFEVSTGEIATKAIADASNIKVLHWELYGDDIRTAAAPLGENTVTDQDGDKKFKVELRLVADQNYNIVFWAETEDGSKHYVTSDLRKVQIKTYSDEKANDESRAAFFGTHSFHTENGVNVNETVVLYRPFAQINLGATTYETSLNLVNGGKVKVESSQMKVNSIANVFNTLDGVGEVDGNFAGEVTFEAAPTPHGIVDETEKKLEVNGETFYWIGMNYLIVEGNSDAIDVDVVLNTNMGTVNHSLSNVPVKENYRTNILGDFLTTGAKFNIIVDERFNQPDQEITYGIPEEPAYNDETKTWSIVKPGNVLWLAAQPAGFAAGKTISFDADINMMGQGIAPILVSNTTVLGNGKTVSNFVVSSNGTTPAGLFSELRGDITDLHLENVKVYAEYKAAALVGQIYGNVQNCSVKDVEVTSVPYHKDGSFDGGNHVGALIGYAAERGKNRKYEHTGNLVDGAVIRGYRNVGGMIGTYQYGVEGYLNTVKNVKVVLDQVTNYYGNKTPNVGYFAGLISSNSSTILPHDNTIENVTIETILPEWRVAAGVKTMDFVGNLTFYGMFPFRETLDFTEDYVVDGNGATMTFVADNASDVSNQYAYTTFSSANKNAVNVKDLNITGEFAFLGTGYWHGAPSSQKEKQFYTTLENVNIIGAKVSTLQVSAQALFCDGVTVLNNCNIYGTELSSFDNLATPVYDLVTFNYTHTTLNGGKYGVVGSISKSPQGTMVINGAEIDTVENWYIARNTSGHPDGLTRGLYVNAGSKIKTINTYGSTGQWTQLQIAEGAEVETLTFDNKAVTNPKFTAEWIRIADGTVGKVIADGTEMTLKAFKKAYNL